MTNLLCNAALLLMFIFVVGCSCYTFNASLQYEDVLKAKEGYNEKNVYLSFDSFVRFYNIAKDKYRINGSYKGYYFSREVVAEKVVYNNYKYTTVYTYNYFMDSFGDHMKYQKFCEGIYKAQQEKESKINKKREEERKDKNLQEYLEIVKADFAEDYIQRTKNK